MRTSLNIIRLIQNSPIRKALSPIENIIREWLHRRSRIIFGPLRGYYFTDFGRGTLLGTYELHVQKAIISSLKKGGVLYDIGAHNGFFALLGSTLVGSKGYIYAFEPLPQNIATLQIVFEKNKIENCEIIPKAASNVEGQAVLYTGDGRTLKASLYQWGSEDSVSIDTITLDEFIKEYRWPDLIKMDVEGAETLVLEGATCLLESKSAPVWIIEVHSEKIDEEIHQILSAHGYRIEPLLAPKGERKPYPSHRIAAK